MKLKKLLNEDITIIQIINEIPTKEELMDYLDRENIELSSIVNPSNLAELIQLKGWRLPSLINVAKPKVTESFLKALLILAGKNHQIKRDLIPKFIKTIDQTKIPKYLLKYYKRLYNKELELLDEDAYSFKAVPKDIYYKDEGGKHKHKRNIYKEVFGYVGIPFKVRIMDTKEGRKTILGFIEIYKDGKVTSNFKNFMNIIEANKKEVNNKIGKEIIAKINKEKASDESKKVIQNKFNDVWDADKAKDIEGGFDFNSNNVRQFEFDLIGVIELLKSAENSNGVDAKKFKELLGVESIDNKDQPIKEFDNRTILSSTPHEVEKFDDTKIKETSDEIEKIEKEPEVPDEIEAPELSKSDERILNRIKGLKELDQDKIKDEIQDIQKVIDYLKRKKSKNIEYIERIWEKEQKNYE